jgi:hypothetical protein
MLVDLEEPMDNNEQNVASQDKSFGKFKLPEFWPHAPGIWFARAELRFEMRDVVSESQHFAYTVDALQYEALCIVADLVESPPAVIGGHRHPEN